MKQRGFAITVYLIAAAVILASIIGWGEYRFAKGVDKERTRTLAAVVQHEAEMSDLRRKHNEELDAMARRLADDVASANRRIRDLLKTNKALADWWWNHIPDPASEFAWMRSAGDNPLRGRSGADSTDTTPGKAGEAH